jgi:pyridoxamine 5'-phosphate oxidase
MTKPRIETLTQIHHACWLELALAARQRDHAFRLMGLATIDGDAADLRTVVLREVQADLQQLVFFTDARSPKVRQLQAHPTATLMVWCARLGWQLRLRASLTVSIDGLAVSSRWARLKMSPAAQDYLSPLPPGAPLDPCVPERATREQFAVVHAQVQTIDWLELHAEGHRRALFDAAGNGQWVTP